MKKTSHAFTAAALIVTLAAFAAKAQAESAYVLTQEEANYSKLIPYISPETVQTDDNFDEYVHGELDSDHNIDAITAEDSYVTITYSEPAKVLGFIPSKAAAVATIKTDGTIDVAYPWYHFLSAKDAASLQADIQSNVAPIIAENVSSPATPFSPQTKAQIIDTAVSIMRKHTSKKPAEASIQAEAAASSDQSQEATFLDPAMTSTSSYLGY